MDISKTNFEWVEGTIIGIGIAAFQKNFFSSIEYYIKKHVEKLYHKKIQIAIPPSSGFWHFFFRQEAWQRRRSPKIPTQANSENKSIT